MEMWEYLKILNLPPKSWFSSKDYTKEKIVVLEKIADDGNSRYIYLLISFLTNKDFEIRNATCKTIIHLFKKIDTKKGYYDALKHCSISTSDIDFYEANFSTDKFVELLAICSLNSDGYVREKAVKKLAQIERPRAIQFLIYRLADWVLPVRQAALKGIENYKSTNYINDIIENLLIIEWLQQVERTDLQDVNRDIIKFITSTNRSYIISNFKKYPDKLRLVLAKHISNSLTDHTKELPILLTDKHFLIRNLAITHYDKLTQNDISQLLNDKSAKVRIQILYCLKDKNGFDATVKMHLADSSATIRHFARFSLKQSNINFADFYNHNLLIEKHIIGSLIGLAEMGAKQYAETAKRYLSNQNSKIKKAAFMALCKLDEKSTYKFAIANLDCSCIGLRNVIIDYLSTAPTQDFLPRARDIFNTNNHELKKSMLKLFSKVGGWAVIADIMIGTIDTSETIRQLAWNYLYFWESNTVRLFSKPTQDEAERARRIFNLVNEIHKDKNYFNTNPVSRLDFYFK